MARIVEYLTKGEINYLKIHSEYWLLKKHCKTAGDILIKVKRSIDSKSLIDIKNKDGGLNETG